jgi:hypothetical protein
VTGDSASSLPSPQDSCGLQNSIHHSTTLTTKTRNTTLAFSNLLARINSLLSRARLGDGRGSRIQLTVYRNRIVALATGNYCNPHLTTSSFTMFALKLFLRAILPVWAALSSSTLPSPLLRLGSWAYYHAGRCLCSVSNWHGCPRICCSYVCSARSIDANDFVSEDPPPVLEVLAASGGCYECRRWGRRWSLQL